MAETIHLNSGAFSSRSFNSSQSDLKRAVDALNSLDYYGALWNATYNCNGYSQRIFTAAMIEEASSLAILTEKLKSKLEAYSKLLEIIQSYIPVAGEKISTSSETVSGFYQMEEDPLEEPVD